MDEQLDPTLNQASDYLSMPGLNLKHVSKWGFRKSYTKIISGIKYLDHVRSILMMFEISRVIC